MITNKQFNFIRKLCDCHCNGGYFRIYFPKKPTKNRAFCYQFATRDQRVIVYTFNITTSRPQISIKFVIQNGHLPWKKIFFRSFRFLRKILRRKLILRTKAQYGDDSLHDRLRNLIFEEKEIINKENSSRNTNKERCLYETWSLTNAKLIFGV